MRLLLLHLRAIALLLVFTGAEAFSQTASPPQITIIGPTGAALAGSPPSVTVSCAPAVLRPIAFGIKNESGSPLTNVSVSLTGDNTSDFSILHLPPTTVASGTVASFVIGYLPKVTDYKTITVNITSAESDQSLASFSLSGSCYSGVNLVARRKSGEEIGLATAFGLTIGTPEQLVASLPAIATGETFSLTNYGSTDIFDLKVTLPPDTSGVTLSSSGLPIGGSVWARVDTASSNVIGNNRYLQISGNNDTIRYYASFGMGFITVIGGGPGIILNPNPGVITIVNPTVYTGATITFTPGLIYIPLLLGPIGNTFSPSTLRLYWRLGENDGAAAIYDQPMTLATVHGVSGTSPLFITAPATNTGTPKYLYTRGSPASAKVGSTFGVHLDGASSVGNNITWAINGSFLIEAWVRPSTTTGTQAIAYSGVKDTNGWGLYQVDGTLRGRMGSIDVGSATFTPGEWVHMALVRFNGVARLYVNGVASGDPVSTAPTNPTKPISIGSTGDHLDYFTGDVDEVSLAFYFSSFDPNQDLMLQLPANQLRVTSVGGGSVTSLDFGDALVGGKSSKTLQLTNTAFTSLTGLAATIDGTEAGDFSITQFPFTTLAGFSSTVVSIQFQPTATGQRNATLHLTSNGQTKDYPLTGVGVPPPEIAVETESGTDASTGSYTLYFGNAYSLANEDEQPTKKLIIRNTGAGPLTNLQANVSDMQGFNFELSSLPASIAPGESATLTIKFHAVSTQAADATLHLISNDVDEGDISVRLYGPGLQQIKVSTPQDALAVNKHSALNFSRKSEQGIVIENSGGRVLKGISATITGPDASDFSVTTPTETSVWSASVPVSSGVLLPAPPATSLSASSSSNTTVLIPMTPTKSGLLVRFSSTTTGIHRAMLHIASNDPAQSSFDIALIARNDWPTPNIEISYAGAVLENGGLLDMGEAYGSSTSPNAQTITRKLVVKNTGASMLSGILVDWEDRNTGYSATVDPLPYPFYLPIIVFGQQGSGLSLAPGESTTISVSNDSSKSTWENRLRIYSSDPDTDPFVVRVATTLLTDPLLRLRRPPDAVFTPGTVIHLPATPLSKSSKVTLELSNLATTSIAGIIAKIENDTSKEFSISAAPSRLGKGDKASLTLTFSPKREGACSAKLRISTNHDVTSDLVFLIDGYGAKAPDFTLEPATKLLTIGQSMTVDAFAPIAMPLIAVPPPAAQTSVLSIYGGFIYANLNTVITTPTIPPGSTLTLNSVPNPSYQWLKNGKPIPGATNSSIVITASSFDDAGIYSLAITNVAGTVTKEAIRCGVCDLGMPRGPSIGGLGKPLTVTTKATGPGVTLQWLEDDKEIPGATNATQRIVPSLTGIVSYWCKITLGGETLATLARQIEIPAAPPEVVEVHGPGESVTFTLNLPVFLPLDTVGTTTRFSMTGQPPGVRIDPITGLISGTPTSLGRFSAKVTAENPAGRTTRVISMQVVPMDDRVVGVFIGSLSADDSINDGLGGMFRIEITRAGTYSGRIWQGKRVTGITGRITSNDGFVLGAETAFTFEPRMGAILSFSVSPESPDSPYGLMTVGVTMPSTSSGLSSGRALKQTRVEPGVAGRWNMIVSQVTSGGSKPIHDGIGFCSSVIEASGSAAYAGRLPDGTAFTGSNGNDPILGFTYFNSLYDGRGSICGTTRTAIKWVKHASPNDRMYPEGWASLTMTIDGPKYAPPAAGKPLFNLPLTSPNAQFVFSDGGLTTPRAMQLAITSSSYKLIAGDAQDALSTRGFWLSLNAGTGLINGGFTLSDAGSPSRTATFFGLEISPELGAVGQFILSPLPGKTAVTGKMELLR